MDAAINSFDALGAYVLTLALSTVLVLVLVLRQTQGKGDLPLWLSAGLVGILLGGAGSAALVKALDYQVVRSQPDPNESLPSGGPTPTTPPMAGPGGGGMMGGGMGGMMGGGMGGGMMGGGMGGGMMGGGGRGPAGKRQLTTLVRKLELLTGDINIQLTPEQGQSIAAQLAEIKQRETMTDDEAQAEYDKLLALLTDDQKQKQDAIGLPFRRGGGGGGGPGGRGGGPGGGPGGPGGGPGGPGGGPGGGGPPDANPFADADAAKSLDALRARLGGAPAGESSN